MMNNAYRKITQYAAHLIILNDSVYKREKTLSSITFWKSLTMKQFLTTDLTDFDFNTNCDCYFLSEDESNNQFE